MQKENKYKRLFEEFNDLNVMIIGDVMVDSYLWGKVERISPEAPIPIVALRKRENRMGGAANVAMNIKSMGARPVLCSVIGDDDKGNIFLDLLRNEKIDSHGIVSSLRRITTTKFRIFGNNTQMLRVDEEVESDLSEHDMNELLDKIDSVIANDRVDLIKKFIHIVFGQIAFDLLINTKHLRIVSEYSEFGGCDKIDSVIANEKIDCIIFQDYNKGVITPSLIRRVVGLAKEKNIPVTVDPKKRNFDAYTGVTLFKPNLKELKEGIRTDFNPDDREGLMQSAQMLRNRLNCDYVMTTMSEHGVMISLKDKTEEKNIFIPAHLRSVADVSGAGDTVISVASLCLALKRSPYEIAYIANLAGGLVCEDAGVVPVNKDKLLKEILALL
jgi:D-glycero-beta-D-manno-heptose-7-phosphate kinase